MELDTKTLPSYETKSEKGRGAGFNPKNRFEEISFEPLEIENDFYDDDEHVSLKTVFFFGTTQKLFSRKMIHRIFHSRTVSIRIAVVNTDAFIVTRDQHMSISGFQVALISKQKLW